MKVKIINTLKHKLQWLMLLAALLGVSQGVWGETTLKVKQYGLFASNNPYIHYWNDGESTWPGVEMENTETDSNSNVWWVVTINSNVPNLIIHDNQGNNPNRAQDGNDNTNLSRDTGSNTTCYTVDSSTHSITSYTCPTACTPPTAGTAYVQDGSGNWGSSLDIYGSSTVNLKVTGYDVGSSIQWQYSTDNSTWNDCSGKTSAEVSITGVDATTYYRAQVDLDNCTAETSAVTVTRKYRIKVKKTSILENSAYIYIWNSSCNAGNWPGTLMTSLDDNWWYTVLDCNPVNIIFNNNSSQTVDVTDRSHDCYEVKGQSDDKYLCDAIDCPSPCSGTVNPGDISITVPASLLLNGGQSATDTPATDQALSATNTGVADTYLWSITPNTINTRKQDGSRGDVERVTFSSTNTLNTTATFKYEGEYTVSFTASCGSSSVTKTADISVKAGRLFIAGPLFNGGSSWATTATLSKDGNDQYTYQWNVNTSYTNQFAINGKDSDNNNNERRLYVVTNYADMDLTNLSMESGDDTNHNLSISDLSYNNGDEMTLTIEYTGMDNSTKKPKYSVSVTACSTPTVSITAGPSAVCANETGVVYTATGSSSVGSISSYTWTCPNGWTKTAQDNNAGTATFTVGSSGGNVSVTATNDCGKTSTAASQAVTIKTAPSDPEFTAGPTTICSGSSNNTYTVSGTADSWEWAKGDGLDGTSSTSSITITAGMFTNQATYVKVRAINCPSNTALYSNWVQRDATIVANASAESVIIEKAGETVTSACIGETGLTASTSGTWYMGGGTGEWSSTATTYATVDASGNITALAAGSPNIKYTIKNPVCGSETYAQSQLSISGPADFDISTDPASGYTPWKPITLSTSPSGTAAWDISTDPSLGQAYLSTTSGSSTVLKAPANASNYTVSATKESGGCSLTKTQTITVTAPECD